MAASVEVLGAGGGLHDETAGQIERPRVEARARCDRDQGGLAGYERVVELGRALLHQAIDRNPFARSHGEKIADTDFGDRYPLLCAVEESHGDRRLQSQKVSSGGARARPQAMVQIATDQ